MVLIINKLLQALSAAGLHAASAYAFDLLPRLIQPMISARLTEYTEHPASLDGTLYLRADGTACCGRRVECTAQLLCYFPYRDGASNCPAYLESVIAALQNGLDMKLERIVVGMVIYQPDEDCYCCKVDVQMGLYQEEATEDG